MVAKFGVTNSTWKTNEAGRVNAASVPQMKRKKIIGREFQTTNLKMGPKSLPEFARADLGHVAVNIGVVGGNESPRDKPEHSSPNKQDNGQYESDDQARPFFPG
jgi:hypothetical protein